jgi:CRP-like cAMP-binding protein
VLSTDTHSALDILRRAALFRPISHDGLGSLAEKCSIRKFGRGQPLMIQDAESDALFIIAHGRVRVERFEPGMDRAVALAELSPGEVVGEMGVLDRELRSATVVAITEVEALRLDSASLAEVMVRHPEVLEALRHIVSERLRSTDALVARMFADLLRTVPIFQPLSEDGLGHLAEKGKRRVFAAGDTLMEQGQVSDAMYVIAQGRVRVERSHRDLSDPIVLARLGPGEVVGEMGVLDGVQRSATVTADTNVETMELDAPAIAGAMAEHPEISNALLHVVTKRMRSTDALMEELLARQKGGGSATGG